MNVRRYTVSNQLSQGVEGVVTVLKNWTNMQIIDFIIEDTSIDEGVKVTKFIFLRERRC